jgi:drug/metabolite transporter (DMT)-like permease
MGKLPSDRTTVIATLAALAAFAANSLLCRRALGLELIDAGAFTLVRIASGALMLAVIVALRKPEGPRFDGTWPSAAALFAYAIGFSLAYRSLSAGVGALLLFGSVQITMIAWGIFKGERPRLWEWMGLAIAVVGLVYLVADRHVGALSWSGSLLMMVAGASWGVYSLRGRGARDPIAATAGNFVLATPLALFAWLLLLRTTSVTTPGLALAITSGALTSGLGYVLWYIALPGLPAIRAALVQLAVPVVTALAAVALLGEVITTRLVVASVLILGGITLAIVTRLRRT